MTDQQCWDSLEKNFGPEGSANSEMRWLESCESSVPNEILARGFRGRVLMLRSFQSFFVESLDCAIRLVKEGGWPKTEFYAEILTLFFTSLRRFRACFILLERGYPLDGMAHLRDVKDRAFILCALARNRTTLPEALGVKPGMTPDNYADKAKNNRIRVSGRIGKEFTGQSSGLAEDDQKRLKKWEEFFHLEVHNGLLTFSTEAVALTQGRVPSIGPASDDQSYHTCANIMGQIGWMVTCLLPLLQPFSYAFGETWLMKQQALTAAFRHMEEARSRSGNIVAEPLIRMMERKFKFKDNLCYSASTYTPQ